MDEVFDYINAKVGRNRSKHAKIVDGILQVIAEGKLQVGDMLPSVNRLMVKYGVGRMMVVL